MVIELPLLTPEAQQGSISLKTRTLIGYFTALSGTDQRVSESFQSGPFPLYLMSS